MNRPSLKQLEAFYWAASLGNFRSAAFRLNTTQPAISNRIQELERTLGVELFDRTTRTARLTPKGRQLFSYAERMLRLATKMQDDVGDKRILHGTVRLGVVDAIALTWLPDLMFRLNETYEGITVELVVDATLRLREQLRQRVIDLALQVGSATGGELVAKPLGALQLSWIGSSKLTIPSGSLTPKELAAWPILSDNPGSLHQILIQEWFRDVGAEPGRINGCNSLATIIRLTIAGLGISMIPPAILKPEIDVGLVRILPCTVRLPRNDYFVIYPRTILHPAVQAVAEFAVKIGTAHPAFCDEP
jgi:DNA-binding transcriptional LysR family regulator